MLVVGSSPPPQSNTEIIVGFWPKVPWIIGMTYLPRTVMNFQLWKAPFYASVSVSGRYVATPALS